MTTPQTQSGAIAWPEAPHAALSRRYRFSASHRLHSDSFTDEQNRIVYGKCNNPHGHGHNYIVELTFSGAVDPATGMVLDLAALDAFARTHLLDRFDTMNLNTVEPFVSTPFAAQAIVPSTENLTLEVFRIFKQFPAATLTRVHIQETGNNSFEFTGPIQKG
jgi:6-pyruvoyltetrahydropterin/6-carboxytetrahydropterin synthase